MIRSLPQWQADANKSASPHGQPAEPNWRDNVPWCASECPHDDGKRCELLGLRTPAICEPAVSAMGAALTAAEGK